MKYKKENQYITRRLRATKSSFFILHDYIKSLTLKKVMLFLVLVIILAPSISSSLVFADPHNTGTPMYSAYTPDQAAKSLSYYNVLLKCVGGNMKGTISLNAADGGNAVPATWFDGGNLLSGEPQGTVFPDGKKDCKDFASDALNLWGYSSNSDFLTSIGYHFDSVADSWSGPGGVGYSNQRASQFQTAVGLKVYGQVYSGQNTDPPISKAAWYQLDTHAFVSDDCKAKDLGIFPTNNTTYNDLSGKNGTEPASSSSTITNASGTIMYTRVALVGSKGDKPETHVFAFNSSSSVVTGETVSNFDTTSVLYGYDQNPGKGANIKSCVDIAKEISDNTPSVIAWNAAHPSQLITSSSTPGLTDNPDKASASTCKIDGLGWIICPVVNLMANMVDAAYGFVSSLLVVQPLMTTGTDDVYKAWSTMRNLANIAFVIAFIIIIFSQLTSVGINNYGIKKMLPRLIVAAIFVNVSYWICAIAVDVSNILGSSLNDLMKGLHTPGSVSNTSGVSSGTGWVGIAGFILAGTIGVGVVLYVGLAALLPALIAALLAIVTVFLVLTLRQALIILLIVISPLAFVAYLLPNTENLFKKWRELFQTLLLMYPIIAFIFGASALASTIVMGSATGPYKVAIQIMGALIAIIPLAITPVVMKSAGGLLNKFGGMVNNPNKGPFDRLRKGAQGVQERAKVSRGLRAMDPNRLSMPGRRSAINFRNKRHAIATGRADQFKEMQAEEIAKLATAEDGKFAAKVAGDPAKASLYQAKQASYLASIDPSKLKLEVDKSQIANMVGTLSLSVEDPANKISEIQKVLDETAKSDHPSDIIKARAAQEILMNSGNKGKEALRESMRKINPNSENGVQLRKDLASSALKANAADMYAWAIDQQHRSLDGIAADSGTWSGLSDAQIAGQIGDSLQEAIKTGAITPERAAAVLVSRGSENIGAKEKAILEAHAAKAAPSATSPVVASASPTVNVSQASTPTGGRMTPPANTMGYQTTSSGLFVPQSVVNPISGRVPPTAGTVPSPSSPTLNIPHTPTPPSYTDQSGRVTPGQISPDQSDAYHDGMSR